ncbi:MAG: ABC transporter permease [Acidimicrobiia bacterium]|nr:ABC transporter permease [Acidimicrobiia bacterium]
MTEVDRGLSRRLVRVLMLVGLCGLLVVGVVAFVGAEDRDPAEQARAALVDSCDYQPEYRAECVAQVPSAEELRVDDPEFVLVNDNRPHLTELWPDDDAREAGVTNGFFLATAIIFLMVAVVLGASLVGADYSSRSIETLLTWEPRRIRVALAKLLAAGVVAFALYLVFLLVQTLVLLPSLLVFGTTEGADSEWFAHLLAMVGQTGALVAGFAIAGGAVALFARNTGGAIGVFLPISWASRSWCGA